MWGGWSLRWYHEFFNDRAMLEAAWMSLRVAVGVGDDRHAARHAGGGCAGRAASASAAASLFSGMLYAPLVMPEVISGCRCCCCSWRSTPSAASGP